MGSPCCPFCRKPFLGSCIVKLHVDRPAPSEQGVEDIELLQRLDAEEAKRQVELEAAVEQSKQRKRALRESLERAHRLQKQREEEAEARKQQPPPVTGKGASGAVPSEREIRIDELLGLFSGLSVTRTVEAAAPPLTRWRRGEGGSWRERRNAPNSSLEGSAAPSSTQWGREGGGWRARATRRNTNADLTSSLASSTHAPLHVFTLSSDFEDGNGDGDEVLSWF